jgi:hypothetical protein
MDESNKTPGRWLALSIALAGAATLGSATPAEAGWDCYPAGTGCQVCYDENGNYSHECVDSTIIWGSATTPSPAPSADLETFLRSLEPTAD